MASSTSAVCESRFKVLLHLDGKPNHRVSIVKQDASEDANQVGVTLGQLKAEIAANYADLAELGICDELQFAYEVRPILLFPTRIGLYFDQL